jgi:hypothetical protein
MAGPLLFLELQIRANGAAASKKQLEGNGATATALPAR